MSYVKTSWVARVGTALNRFLKTNETSTEVELTNDPTGVTIAGTPFTVDNMNKIEQGIYDNSVHAESDGKDHSDVVLNNSHRVNTSNPHSVTKEQITGLKSTDSPTFAKLTLTTSTYGSQSIAIGETWVVPAGIYAFLSSSTISVQMQNDGGSWADVMQIQGVLISDGSNIRLKNNNSQSAITIQYRKFS